MAGKNSVFVDNSAPSVDATYLNLYKTESNNIITTSGQSLSDAISNQEVIGISRYAANNFYIDSGAADAYVLTLAASMTNPVSATVGYYVGMTIRFRAGNANTGASTVNVNSAGVKNLLKEDFSTALSANDIPTNRDVEFRYNGTAFGLVQNVVFATTTTSGSSLLPSPITIANNSSDPNNDIDFSAGAFQFSDGSGQAVATAMTKRFDAIWAAGTGNGGLDTGSLSNNTTYYLYAIFNPTSFATDFIATATKGSPLLPSGFTKISYLAAFRTNGSAVIRNGSWSIGNGMYSFSFKPTEAILVSSDAIFSTSEKTINLGIPTGKVFPNMAIFIQANTSAGGSSSLEFYSTKSTYKTTIISRGGGTSVPNQINLTSLLISDSILRYLSGVSFTANAADWYLNGWTEFL